MSREGSDVLDALGMVAKGEDALEEGVVKKKKDAQIGDDEEVPVYLWDKMFALSLLEGNPKSKLRQGWRHALATLRVHIIRW